jgi:hypothetical protein
MTVPSATAPWVPEESGPASVHCGLYRFTPKGLSQAGLVSAGDELVLGVEVRALPWPCELIVQLWRGEQLRHTWQQRLEAGAPVALALRLRWGEAGASSRLTCRVLLDWREVARRTVLLGPGPVDAQGRLPGSSPPAASPESLLAFAMELHRHFENGGEQP